jgi:hypothetical protein
MGVRCGIDPGWYVSTCAEEDIGDGPFETREEALAHAASEMRDDATENGTEAFTVTLNQCVPADPPSWARLFDASYLLEQLAEEQLDACLAEGWPESPGPAESENLERELGEVLERHLRAWGQWPRLTTRGPGEEVRIQAAEKLSSGEES